MAHSQFQGTAPPFLLSQGWGSCPAAAVTLQLAIGIDLPTWTRATLVQGRAESSASWAHLTGDYGPGWELRPRGLDDLGVGLPLGQDMSTVEAKHLIVAL